jgi:hypothetical protein
MAKSVFALDFVSPRRSKDRPFSPKARIAVRAFTQDTADGLPFVASGTSFQELKDGVNDLIKDLKRVRKEAKRLFEKYQRDFPARKKTRSTKGK